MTDWFLPQGSPGSPDEWCFQTVPTTEIRVHVGFNEYSDRLAQLFSQATDGDEIFIVGFDIVVERILSDKHKDFPLLLTWLESAWGRKARVRLLSTPTNGVGTENEAQMQVAKDHKLDAVVDRQLPAGDHWHHQKAVFVKLQKSTHLFVGGMDLARGRREWFDVQAEIIGLGAHLGRKTLEERWESVTPPAGGLLFTKRALPSAGGTAHQVQFVRTYPPFPTDTTGWTRTFAPGGEHTYYALLCRAIASAKERIYLEEQFFETMGPAPTRSNPVGGSSPRLRSDVPDVPDTVERLLADAVGRGVKLVVVAANYSGPNRKALVQMLQSTTNPPVLLRPKKGMWFVHSKTWIFDDEFVLIGSANLWPQSLVSVQTPAEAEFGVAFTSAQQDGEPLGFKGVSFARALRIKMWERLRQNLDANYKFPRDAKANFDEEVKELQKPIGGSDPFVAMS